VANLLQSTTYGDQRNPDANAVKKPIVKEDLDAREDQLAGRRA
jgi:hypothetical protein